MRVSNVKTLASECCFLSGGDLFRLKVWPSTLNSLAGISRPSGDGRSFAFVLKGNLEQVYHENALCRITHTEVVLDPTSLRGILESIHKGRHYGN